MTFRTRLLTVLIVCGILGWMSWNVYGYFFSYISPELDLYGVLEDGCYAGEAACVIKARDAYRVGDATVNLDGKQLTQAKCYGRNLVHPVTIDTENLTNGQHELEVIVENGTYHTAKATKKIQFYVDNMPLHAALIAHCQTTKVPQGRTVRLKFQVNKEVDQATAHVFSTDYDFVRDGSSLLVYECFIPVDCEEAAGSYPTAIEITDKVGNTMQLDAVIEVTEFPFKRQRLNISSEKIKAENEAGLSEKELEKELEELVAQSPKEKLWQGRFVTPIEITDKKQITTDYGVIRTTQERGLRQHKALDVYTMPKSVVWATQDGIVVLKNRYAHSGNTVVLDHGCGIFTLYFHLDSFADIEVGDKLKRGNPVGKLGKTGYATGYHLHWEMRIHNTCVDPMQWTKSDF